MKLKFSFIVTCYKNELADRVIFYAKVMKEGLVGSDNMSDNMFPVVVPYGGPEVPKDYIF